jgi:putative transposase
MLVTCPSPAGNTGNGKCKKTRKGEFGASPIALPRDRHASFEPQIIPRHQTRWTGFHDKILSLYARGHDGAGDSRPPGRDAWHRGFPNAHFLRIDTLIDEVKTWRSRPLEGLCPRNRPRAIPFFDFYPEILKVIYTTRRG